MPKIPVKKNRKIFRFFFLKKSQKPEAGFGATLGAGGSNFKKGIYNKTRYLSGGCLI